MNVSREAFSPREEVKKGGTAKYVSPFADVVSDKGIFCFIGKNDSYTRKEKDHEENTHARQRGRGQRTV